MAASFMGIVMLLGLAGGGGLPLGLPPAAEDPVVANAAPEECLFYLSWAGTAKPDPKSPNQVEQLIAEPEVQQLAAEVERRIREGLQRAASREGPEAAKMVDELVDLAKKALTSPAAIYLRKVEIGRRGPPVIQAGAIVGLGDDAAKVRATLENYAKVLPPGALQTVQVGGETFWSIKPDPDAPTFALGVHGKHFVLGIGDGEAEAMVKRMSGQPPAWLAQVRQQLPVERPSSVMYVNVKKIVGMIQAFFGERPGLDAMIREVVRSLGLDNFTSLASVSGLEKTGFVSRTLLATEKPDGDILSFLNAKPLEAKDLAPIPRDATLAKAVRFDADRFFETIFAVMAKIDPREAQDAAEGLAEAEKELGFKVREDLLQTLGDVWCVYNSPGEGGLVVTGLTAVVGLKDPQRAAKTHEKLLALIQRELDQERKLSPRWAPRVDEMVFAGRKVYTFSVPDRGFPFAPSWCLTDKELIVALFPQNVKAYLSRGPDFQSLSAAPEVAEALRSRPTAVAYVDTAELFRLFYPILQMGAKMAFGEMQREGIDVDVSLLPSAASIGRHLRPGTWTVRRTEAGIEITARQSVPGGGAAIVLPMAAFWTVGVHRVERRYDVKKSAATRAIDVKPEPGPAPERDSGKTEVMPIPEPKPEPPPEPAPERKLEKIELRR